VDLNCFNRADNVENELGIRWTWDDTDSWTGTGQTGDGCSLLDTDGDGNVNYSLCVRVTNNAEGTDVYQLPLPESPVLYQCGNKRSDRCTNPIEIIDPLPGETECTVDFAEEGFPGAGEDGADTQATCYLDLGEGTFGTVENISLVNVCTYPSGEPNSNAFDCVVEAGSGFIKIVKDVTPSVAELFGFTLSPIATDLTSKYAVAGGVSSALIPVEPGTSFSLTETLPEYWQIGDAECVLGQNGPTGTFSLANREVTGIEVATGQTTTCTFQNYWEYTGDVTYWVTVKNLGLEPVDLDVLSDDWFGDLNPYPDCETGGTILGQGSYTCSFTESITGVHGATHINQVTANASDNEGTQTGPTLSNALTVTFWHPAVLPLPATLQGVPDR
jgi:hypothetical protein